MTRNYIEFGTRNTDADTPANSGHEILFLKGPLSEVSDQASGLIIAGEPVEVDESVLRHLAKTLLLTEQLERAQRRVNCFAFTAMLAGGCYGAQGAYKRRKIDFGEAIPVDEAAEPLDSMRPMVMGGIGVRGVLCARHATIRLPTQEPLWIHKYGGLRAGIASLRSAATFYSATHISEAYKIHWDEAVWEGEPSESSSQNRHSYTQSI